MCEFYLESHYIPAVVVQNMEQIGVLFLPAWSFQSVVDEAQQALVRQYEFDIFV